MSNLIGLVKKGEAVLLFSDKRVVDRGRGNKVTNNNYKKIWCARDGSVAHGMIGDWDLYAVPRLRQELTRLPLRTFLQQLRGGCIDSIHDFDFKYCDDVDFLFGVGSVKIGLYHVSMTGRASQRKWFSALGAGEKVARNILLAGYHPAMPLEEMILLGYEALIAANKEDPRYSHGADFVLLTPKGNFGNRYLRAVLREHNGQEL